MSIFAKNIKMNRFVSSLAPELIVIVAIIVVLIGGLI